MEQTNFSFDVALKALKEGKEVKRASWPDKNFIAMVDLSEYVCITSPKEEVSGFSIIRRKSDPEWSTEDWKPTNNDLLAEDWIVLQ